MNQKIRIEIAVGLIVAIAILLGMYFWNNASQVSIDAPTANVDAKPAQKMCTQEAKLCDDGSYVSRTGPNCEFAVCSEAKDNEAAGRQVYRNEKYGFEFQYPVGYKLEWAIDYADANSLRENEIDVDNLVDLDRAEEKQLLLSVNLQQYGLDVVKTKYSSIDTWFAAWKKEVEKKSNYEGTIIEPQIISVEDMDVQGVIGKKVRISNLPYSDTIFSIIKNGYLYTLSYNGTIKSNGDESDNKFGMEKVDEHRVIFNKLVATFKFTK